MRLRSLLCQDASLLAILWSAIALGCSPSPPTVGPKKHSIEGIIRFNAEPLSSGQIVFIDVEGDPPRQYGAAIVAGAYKTEVTPGSKRVEITAREQSDSSSGDPGANLTQIIPERYNTQSTLTAEVAEGENKNIDFELTTDE